MAAHAPGVILIPFSLTMNSSLEGSSLNDFSNTSSGSNLLVNWKAHVVHRLFDVRRKHLKSRFNGRPLFPFDLSKMTGLRSPSLRADFKALTADRLANLPIQMANEVRGR